jgi:ABC-type nitrate/sulfonate/bicarbonate transport system ATPase subunit
VGTIALRVAAGTKSFFRDGHEHVVFQGIDLAVEQGEVFALLGPSGCGKSTLLRTIANLEHLTGGDIEINGDNLRGGRRHAVGVAFQDPLLLPWLTVAENVGLGLRYRANRGAARTESVEQILHDFGLSATASSYPGELSGGQAQRASLARTIITRPEILLLDEPFAALDPRTRATLQDWLLDVTRQRGLTVVVVTHDVDEAMYLGDRIALMSRDPGTITNVWVTRDHRHRHGDHHLPERTLTIRREILANYQSDVPTTPLPADYAI